MLTGYHLLLDDIAGGHSFPNQLFRPERERPWQVRRPGHPVPPFGQQLQVTQCSRSHRVRLHRPVVHPDPSPGADSRHRVRIHPGLGQVFQGHGTGAVSQARLENHRLVHLWHRAFLPHHHHGLRLQKIQLREHEEFTKQMKNVHLLKDLLRN